MKSLITGKCLSLTSSLCSRLQQPTPILQFHISWLTSLRFSKLYCNPFIPNTFLFLLSCVCVFMPLVCGGGKFSDCFLITAYWWVGYICSGSYGFTSSLNWPKTFSAFWHLLNIVSKKWSGFRIENGSMVGLLVCEFFWAYKLILIFLHCKHLSLHFYLFLEAMEASVLFAISGRSRLGRHFLYVNSIYLFSPKVGETAALNALNSLGVHSDCSDKNQHHLLSLLLVIWMRMAPRGSHLWMLSSESGVLWEGLGVWLVEENLIGGSVSLEVSFKVSEAQARLSCLSWPAGQDVALSHCSGAMTIRD